MPNDDVTVELLVNIPQSDVERISKDFESEGFTVEVAQQASGTFAVAAAKPN